MALSGQVIGALNVIRQALEEKDATIAELKRALSTPYVELMETNAQLRAALKGVHTDYSALSLRFKLSEHEAAILLALRQLKLATWSTLTSRLALAFNYEGPGERSLCTRVCRLRKKLALEGVEILTVHGEGVRLTDANKVLLDKLEAESEALERAVYGEVKSNN